MSLSKKIFYKKYFENYFIMIADNRNLKILEI